MATLSVESCSDDEIKETWDSGILINKGRRSVRWPGVVGARVIEGKAGTGDIGGIGDCVLMDFRKGFFAVSDSPTRSPTASWHFLSKFGEVLEDFPKLRAGQTYSLENFGDIKSRLAVQAEEVLGKTPYAESCTFTGILCAKTAHGVKGFVLHTGDSLLFQINRADAELKQLTKTNFWMAGRTKRFFQVEEVEIPHEAILMLATDGVSSLDHVDGYNQSDLIKHLAISHSVEEIPDKLLERLESKHLSADDIGIVTLIPSRLRFLEATVLLGGTKDWKKRGSGYEG